MELKPGSRLRSLVCSAEFVVVRPPVKAGLLECGGYELAAVGAAVIAPPEIKDGLADGILVGKRYSDAETGLELLASKAGRGTLTIDGRKMSLKDVKPLPSSD
jgi:hypothetical protein